MIENKDIWLIKELGFYKSDNCCFMVIFFINRNILVIMVKYDYKR